MVMVSNLGNERKQSWNHQYEEVLSNLPSISKVIHRINKAIVGDNTSKIDIIEEMVQILA